MDNGTVAGVNATSSTISFNVQGTTTLDPFNVSSSSGTSILRVTQRGNVGIGTTTPGSKLAVSGGVSIGAGINYVAPTNGLLVQGNVGIGNNNPSYAPAAKLNIALGVVLAQTPQLLLRLPITICK